MQGGTGIRRGVAAGLKKRDKARSKGVAEGGSLRPAIPIFLSERPLRQNGGKPEDASFEVQFLVLAEEYEALNSGQRGAKMSPSRAGQEVIKRAGSRYDSLIVEAFTKAFGGQAAAAGV